MESCLSPLDGFLSNNQLYIQKVGNISGEFFVPSFIQTVKKESDLNQIYIFHVCEYVQPMCHGTDPDASRVLACLGK